MANQFDIAILGSGPGGYVAALKAAQMGASVAVIEQHPFFGGTCLNWGCIPSKALLASSELIYKLREHGPAMGIEIQGQVVHNWPVIQKRKDQVLQQLRNGIKGLFKARRITAFQGRAVLAAPGRVAVLGPDGAATAELTANKVILAMGSVPSRIPGWPFDGEKVCTSDEALHWKDLPGRLLIVGGGVIGCEFACMLQPLGVQVTIVEMMEQLIPGLDEHLAEALKKSLEARGIAIHLGVKVEDMKVSEAARATISGGTVIEADRVLVATGRRPATADTGLEAAGITLERGYIQVNDQMETGVAGHYAIGDANGRMMLAHAASAQGVVAVKNALGGSATDEAPVPVCVYTFPAEIAAVGLTQAGCRKRGLPVRIGAFPLSHLGKAMAVGETEGFIKVIRNRETDELLGVHMYGHNVTEIIAAAGNLLHARVHGEQIAEMIYAHPTISEALGEAVHDTYGEALHLPPRQVLRVGAGA